MILPDRPILPDDQRPKEEIFRLTSLRWFLRTYRKLRPELVSELHSRVIPPYRESCIAHRAGRQAAEKGAAVQEALEGWIFDFGLPNTFDMRVEAIRTLLTPSPSGRMVFWWESTEEMIEMMIEEDSPKGSSTERIVSYPFTFQARGWMSSKESLRQARRRLREEFEKALSEQIYTWKGKADLTEFSKLEPTHTRHLDWLAFKQAYPDYSLQDLVRKCGGSIYTVRRGLHAAADWLSLPRESIRKAPPGRKKRPSSI
jgi:hypothetical protein